MSLRFVLLAQINVPSTLELWRFVCNLSAPLEQRRISTNHLIEVRWCTLTNLKRKFASFTCMSIKCLRERHVLAHVWKSSSEKKIKEYWVLTNLVFQALLMQWAVVKTWNFEMSAPGIENFKWRTSFYWRFFGTVEREIFLDCRLVHQQSSKKIFRQVSRPPSV